MTNTFLNDIDKLAVVHIIHVFYPEKHLSYLVMRKAPVFSVIIINRHYICALA